MKSVCDRKSFCSTSKKPRYVRVNALFYTPDEVIKIFRKEGWCFLPTPSNYSDFLKTISNLENNVFTRDFHVKELLVFSPSAEFHENKLFRSGSILLQDKASCLPAFLLKPKPDSVVYDMCAAPGMKTSHLSAIMNNKGKIYATEIDGHRFKALCDVIQYSGCSNVTPILADALTINENRSNEDFSWAQEVEYILVDPSCSGSGIVERLKIFKDEKIKPERLKKLCGFQFKLLKHALTSFPKVKRVVYSTCSLEPQENEKVVEDVLKKLNNSDEYNVKFRLVEALKDCWPRRGSDDYENGRYCIYADPVKDLTNGFFVAVLERTEKNITPLENQKIIADEKVKKKVKNNLKNLYEENVSEEVEKPKKKKRKSKK